MKFLEADRGTVDALTRLEDMVFRRNRLRAEVVSLVEIIELMTELLLAVYGHERKSPTGIQPVPGLAEYFAPTITVVPLGDSGIAGALRQAFAAVTERDPNA